MNRPNLFILGFPKCGTSSLHSTLVCHKSVGEGEKKEPHTYAFEDRYFNRKDYFNYHIDQQSSKEYFLDSSTTYIVNPKAIGRINADVSNAKFIVVLRDPIDRVISHFNWLVSLGQVQCSFKEEIEGDFKNSFDPLKCENGRYKNYILFSLYSQHLNSLGSLVNHDKILILGYNELVSQWPEVSKRIYDFLGIENLDIKFHSKNRTKEIIEKNTYNESLVWMQVKQLRRRILGRRVLRVDKSLLVNRNKSIEKILYPYLNKELQMFREFSDKNSDSTIYFKKI